FRQGNRVPPNEGGEDGVPRRSVLPFLGERVTTGLLSPDVARALPELAATGQTRADSARGEKHDTTDDGRAAAFGPDGGRARRGGDAGGGACLAPPRPRGRPSPPPPPRPPPGPPP